MNCQGEKKISSILKEGGIGVLPTDTIYGLVGSALNKNAVRRIYRLRRRNPRKPMIILIGSLGDLDHFGVKLNKKTTRFLKAIWLGQKQHTNKLKFVGVLFCDKSYAAKRIGPVSVILPISHRPSAISKFRYLHRGTKSLAFRLPKPYWLRRLLAKTGPLVAPSANPEGKPPARTIKEARKYFSAKGGSASGGGDQADFYVDAGKIAVRPSKLIQITEGKIKILRK